MGKLEEIESTFSEIESRMVDPALSSNLQEMHALGKRHSELSPIVAALREYRGVLRGIQDARELLSQEDEGLRELAKEELSTLEEQVEPLEQRIKVLLLPQDPNDAKDVVIEVRAGAGGEEAALFAADLFRMYNRFAEREGWGSELLSTNDTGIGGYKEVVFHLKGTGVYSKLKYESGVHRVQRIPVTEAGGRIHTSTATVAVLPEAEEVDVQVRTEDLKIDTYRASGAGGQYVNMTDSAVRITHIPTGIIVSCQVERSQHMNRATALQVLKSKLFERQLQERQEHLESLQGEKRSIAWGSQIRSYTLQPFQLVKDHRSGCEVGNVAAVLDGDLEELIMSTLRFFKTGRTVDKEGA